MNGLLSSTPAPAAIRLVLAGYLLLLVQATLVLLAPDRTGSRAVAGLIGIIAWASLATAIAGVPDAPEKHRRWRHGR